MIVLSGGGVRRIDYSCLGVSWGFVNVSLKLLNFLNTDVLEGVVLCVLGVWLICIFIGFEDAVLALLCIM